MKGPRGSLGHIYDLASQIAQSRLEAVGEYLDNVAEVQEPSVGSLSNSQFRALLRNSQDFQESLLEKQVFATDKERAALRKTIDEMFPPELPAEVDQVPPRPWEP